MFGRIGLIVIPLTFVCCTGFLAQTRILDSLKHSLASAKHDTTRCSAYISLGMELYPKDPDSSLTLWRKSQELASRGRSTKEHNDLYIVYSNKLADTYNKIGFLKKGIKSIDSSVWYHEAAIRLFQESNNLVGVARSYNNLGILFWENFNYLESQSALEKGWICIRTELKSHPTSPNQRIAGTISRSLGMAYLLNGKNKEAKEFFDQGIGYFEAAGDNEGICNTLTNLSALYAKTADFAADLEVNTKCIELSRKIKNTKVEGIALNNLGSLYIKLGNIAKAFECYDRSLKIKEDNYRSKKSPETYKSLGAAFLNLATLYKQQGEYERSLNYYLEASKIAEELNDPVLMQNAYLNLGSLYTDEEDPDFKKSDASTKMSRAKRSYNIYLKGIKLSEQTGDKRSKAFLLINIGQVYRTFGDTLNNVPIKDSPMGLKKALDCLNEAIELLTQIEDNEGASTCLNNIAGIELARNQVPSALLTAKKSYQLSQITNIPENIKEASFLLAIIYKRMGDHKNALHFTEMYIGLRDSLNNESTRKASIRSQLKYEYEKEAAADSVAHAKESEVKNAELKRQEAEINAKKNQQFALFGGLFLVMLFSVFTYNRFKVTQKQKSIIEHQKSEVEEQKKLVEEKQKEILDSIHYAKRIQLAQIPSERRVNAQLQRAVQKP